jgi:arabinofuranan 3-O-arabinosyltransferase
MQTKVAPAGSAAPVPPSPLVWRLRSVAVCAVLTALAFLQDPGLIVVDTKVDLTVNPVGWLARAMHVWNPSGTFGQLQNQSYGYLWPMGPFFAAGHALHIPEWVTQRLWWASLMCLGFTGVVALARRMAIGTPATRFIAGVAFALTPRILTEMGTISVEAWPMALAPWVLVPLIALRHGAPIRRSVALSALAVACAGGVNATASVAVAPLALLWLATLRPVRRRLLAIAAWCVAVACATAWWIVPLLVLGRYSPPFLNFIETAAVTTQVTDTVTVLRGASHWLAYLSGIQGPVWPAGWRLAIQASLIVPALALVVLGLAGLGRRGMPHRRVLVAGLLVGVALVGLGHVGEISGFFAGQQRSFLDGAGAPLRNVHKFDVVLRLPLVLGLAHLLGLFARAAATARRPLLARLRSVALTTVAVVAVVGVATPALAGTIPAPGSFTQVPVYWRMASGWLNAHLGRDRVLVLPAARFPNYLWGSPAEEVTQPLITGEWAVRNSIPLTPPTTIRFLDAVESALESGQGSLGLADFLARSGVRYVLLRSDLNYGISDTTRPAIVRQAITRSPGFTLVAGFGPTVGGGQFSGEYADAGLDVAIQALEVYEIDRPVAPVVAYDAADVTTVVGGPESVLAAEAAGQLSAAPTVLAGDAPPNWPGPVLVTDGLRRREVAFGVLRDNTSATMAPDDRYSLAAPAHDYGPSWTANWQTVVGYRGITSVTASSSWSQALGLGNGRPEHQPYAALDGDPDTSWRSAPGTYAVGQWLEIVLDRPQAIAEVRVHIDTAADSAPTRMTVSTGSKSVSADVAGDVVVARFPGGSMTRIVRVQVDAAVAVRVGFGGVGISEVEIPGVTAERTLITPAPPASGRPATVVLSAAPTTASCFFIADEPRCADGVSRGSEDGNLIDRTFTLPKAGTYVPSLWVRPRPGADLNAFLDREVAASTLGAATPRVTASSTGFPDPAARPGAVLDGDPATAWTAALGDAQPWLRLTWSAPRTITGLRLGLDPGVAGARPFGINVVGSDGIRTGLVQPSGLVVFDQPLHTNQITVFFSAVAPARSYDPYSNRYNQLAIAIGDLTVLPEAGQAARATNSPAAQTSSGSSAPTTASVDLGEIVSLPCGSGPTVAVGGLRLRTAVTATLRDFVQLREVPATFCGPGDQPLLSLPAGQDRAVAMGDAMFTPTTLALAPDTIGEAPASSPLRIDQWAATSRKVRLDRGLAARVLAVRENTNPGWRATLDGRVLTPIVVDGWQQGWVVPAGAGGEVVLTFTPDRPYRIGLAVGGGLLLLLVILAAWPSRRRGYHAELPTARSRRGPWVVSAVVGGVALLLVGGAAAALLTIGGVIVGYAWRVIPHAPDDRPGRGRRALNVALWLAPAVLYAVAGWLSLRSLAPRTAAEPQLVALAALTASWLSITVPVRRRGHRVPQR